MEDQTKVHSPSLADLLSPEHPNFAALKEGIAKASYEQRMRGLFPTTFDAGVSINPRLGMGSFCKYDELPETQKIQERDIAQAVIDVCRFVLPFRLKQYVAKEPLPFKLWDILNGGSDCSVEIPELTSFITEIDSVCRTHRISFQYEYDSANEVHHTSMVPYHRNSFYELELHVNKMILYSSDVPWLKEAIIQAEILHNLKCETRERTQKAQADAKQQQVIDEQMERLKTEGIVLDDGKYRLVKEDD